MKEQLVIRDFGPIRQARIEVGALTVFVGQQATGKSLAAQLLYFFRAIEDLLPPDPAGLIDEVALVTSALNWWLGANPAMYMTSETILEWMTDRPAAETVCAIEWRQDGLHLNDVLRGRVARWRESGRERVAARSLLNGYWDCPAQVYIPAGRALYSFLPPYALVRRLPVEQWPGHIRTFYETLGAAVQYLWRIENQSFSLDAAPEAAFVRARMESVIRGRLRYGPDTVLLDIGRARLQPTTIAAGQMEIWPFWAILEAGLKSGKLGFNEAYFEEPEAHLHPGAQRNVMEVVAYLVRRQRRFLLTTHSPYILYAMNNFLLAHKVLGAGRPLPLGFPVETELRPEQVSAYRFSPDGEIHSIMDKDVGLIDEEELDRVAEELGTTFSLLQERLGGAE
jgi:hypothetical protein